MNWKKLPALLAALVIFTPSLVFARPVLCTRVSDGKITIREKRCRATETKISNQSQLTGLQGAPGTNGADGQLRIYGNGSAGSLTVSGAGFKFLYTDYAADGNLQFTNVTIEAGASLVVPSGTVIRCTGTFTNNGDIYVRESNVSGGKGYFFSGTSGPFSSPGGMLGGSPAAPGEVGDNSEFRSGGQGGKGLSATEARSLLLPGPAGAGGGAGGLASFGAKGGGSFVVIARGGIQNTAAANIYAFGELLFFVTGSGGSAGGIVVLASPTSVVNNGSINATGVNGSPSGANEGPGGGGGGGIVQLISPSITAGNIDVDGGLGGAAGAPGSANAATRAGGGGGGGCGGDGGQGGDVNPAGDPQFANAGGVGHVITLQADPTALF